MELLDREENFSFHGFKLPYMFFLAITFLRTMNVPEGHEPSSLHNEYNMSIQPRKINFFAYNKSCSEFSKCDCTKNLIKLLSFQ